MILTSGNSQEDTTGIEKKNSGSDTCTTVARLKIIKIMYVIHHHACWRDKQSSFGSSVMLYPVM
jgi:hypothetical protein